MVKETEKEENEVTRQGMEKGRRKGDGKKYGDGGKRRKNKGNENGKG